MIEPDSRRAQVEDIITRLLGLVERTHAHAERALIELELGKTEAHVLRVLEPGRPVLTRELAARMHKDPSNLASVLLKLEERELVDRRIAPHDRGARLLVLTPEERACVRSCSSSCSRIHPRWRV